MQQLSMLRNCVNPVLFWAAIAGFGCSGFARRDRTPDQIAAETALLSKKTALLERENQVLRDENLELVRASDLQKAEQQKKQAEFQAERERLAGQIKTAEATIANLNEKIGILESESGGKIRQLTTLNEQLAKKSADELRRAQEELAKVQLESAQEKERLGREAAEKQFALGKEIQELRQRIAEKEKEGEELRRKTAELRETGARLERELAELRAKMQPTTSAK